MHGEIVQVVHGIADELLSRMRAQALGVARRIDSGPVLKRTPERENRIYRER